MKHDYGKAIVIAKRVIKTIEDTDVYVDQVVNTVFEELVMDSENIEALRYKLDEKEHLLATDTTLSSRERSAHKAHITMFKQRLDRALSSDVSVTPKKQPSTYDRTGKNEFRDKVIDCARNTIFDENEYILTLEAPELLFVKKLRRRKFVIYEQDISRFCQIRDNAKRWGYNNVVMRNGDIVNAGRLLLSNNIVYKFGFIDFCNTFSSNIDRLRDMADALEQCEYIALTFCLRGNTSKNTNLYAAYIIKVLQDIFDSHKLDDALSYRDGAPMIGIILKKR
jgi:hypothetical protein